MKAWLYVLTLFLHSWLRWGVVVLGLLTLARSVRGWTSGRDWSRTDQRVRQLFITVLDTQVLLGLLLYLVLSPLTPRDVQALRAAMPVSTLRFFSLEHVVMMVAALFVAHAASISSRKAPDALTRHRRWTVGLLLTLACIVIGIPWPGLPYGRPLMRALPVRVSPPESSRREKTRADERLTVGEENSRVELSREAGIPVEAGASGGAG